jgi:hypothetical protein
MVINYFSVYCKRTAPFLFIIFAPAQRPRVWVMLSSDHDKDRFENMHPGIDGALPPCDSHVYQTPDAVCRVPCTGLHTIEDVARIHGGTIDDLCAAIREAIQMEEKP